MSEKSRFSMARYVIYKEGPNFMFTNRANYESRIPSANQISTFYRRDGFETPEDVVDYMLKYSHGLTKDDIDILCNKGPIGESVSKFAKFASDLECPEHLIEAATAAFKEIMLEASKSAELAEQLRQKVGVNPNETRGLGVFGLSGNTEMSDSDRIDQKIADGMAAGSFDALGDDLTTASPSDFNETDMGLGDSELDDFGNELNPDDWATEEPAPEEGTDEEPNESDDAPTDDTGEPEDNMEELNLEEL